MTGHEKLNMHIIFESVLMLLTKKLSTLAWAYRNYSLPNLAHFFETQCTCIGILTLLTFGDFLCERTVLSNIEAQCNMERRAISSC